MLNKVAHYAGFQSYSDLPYPTLKAGKKQLESNTVYQETVRKTDELNLYQNTNRWQTLYDQNLSKTVQPENYQNPLRVSKYQVEKTVFSTAGKNSTMKDSQLKYRNNEGEQREAFAADSKGMQLYHQTVRPLKKDDSNDDSHRYRMSSCDARPGSSDPNLDEYDYVQTGTEHWKTTYNAGIKDPYAGTKATRPEWSLHKAPYTVSGGPRTSDYKTQFGERGTNPADKISTMVQMPPVPKSQEALCLGTTKSTFHIPGYTGHMPKSLIRPESWNQALGVESRTTYMKQNITENYQVRVPGYAGHRPANAINDRGNIRSQCFSTAGERFC